MRDGVAHWGPLQNQGSRLHSGVGTAGAPGWRLTHCDDCTVSAFPTPSPCSPVTRSVLPHFPTLSTFLSFLNCRHRNTEQ